MNSNETLFVPWVFPSLNELIGWAIKSPHLYNKKKKSIEAVVCAIVRTSGLSAFQWAGIDYVFHEPKKTRDPSNVASAAIKFIEDALVRSCVLPNDGWENVLGFTVQWEHSPEKPGVSVTITGELSNERRHDLERRKVQKEAKDAVERAKSKRSGQKRSAVGAAAAREAAERNEPSARGAVPARDGGRRAPKRAPAAGAARGRSSTARSQRVTK